MGNIEHAVRKRVKKQNIQRAILAAIKVAGILSLAMMAPNTLQLLKYAPGMRSRYATRVSESLRRLESKGLIKIEGRGPRQQARLTKRGESLLARLEIGSARYKPPARWDRRWRIVMFDIAESRRPDRDRLRHLLVSIGFHKLQDSVWIFPYDCEDVVALLKADFALGREVLYVVTDQVEGERWLRGLFKLPSDEV